MARKENWEAVLKIETKRWAELSYEQLTSKLHDVQGYEVEFDSKTYQVEVEILEQTLEDVHVMVAVDDGNILASVFPSTSCFLRHKDCI